MSSTLIEEFNRHVDDIFDRYYKIEICELTECFRSLCVHAAELEIELEKSKINGTYDIKIVPYCDELHAVAKSIMTKVSYICEKLDKIEKNLDE